MSKEIYKAAVDEITADPMLIKKTMENITQRKKNKRNIYRYSAVAACIIVTLTATFAVPKILNLWPAEEVPGSQGNDTHTAGNTTEQSNPYPAQLHAGETIALADGKGSLHMNTIEDAAPAKLAVPEDSYTKELTVEEMTEYFGRNPLPAVPEGFKAESDKANFMFKADGTIFYMSPFHYYQDMNNPESPNVAIQMDKGALPRRDCFYRGDMDKESLIGSTKVVAGVLKMGEKFTEQGEPTSYYDIYYAEFVHDGIGYSITAERVTGEVFIELLESIIL